MQDAHEIFAISFCRARNLSSMLGFCLCGGVFIVMFLLLVLIVVRTATGRPGDLYWPMRAALRENVKTVDALLLCRRRGAVLENLFWTRSKTRCRFSSRVNHLRCLLSLPPRLSHLSDACCMSEGCVLCPPALQLYCSRSGCH